MNVQIEDEYEFNQRLAMKIRNYWGASRQSALEVSISYALITQSPLDKPRSLFSIKSNMKNGFPPSQVGNYA